MKTIKNRSESRANKKKRIQTIFFEVMVSQFISQLQNRKNRNQPVSSVYRSNFSDLTASFLNYDFFFKLSKKSTKPVGFVNHV
jgi:hypothetical protein